MKVAVDFYKDGLFEGEKTFSGDTFVLTFDGRYSIIMDTNEFKQLIKAIKKVGT